MRHRDPGAGKRPFASAAAAAVSSHLPFSRRRFLGAGLAAFALAAAGPGRAAEPALLTPAQSVAGGRLLRRVDAQGLPAPGADAFGPMTFFVFPVAVAATPFDLYVADAGLGALFRYDAMLDGMFAVPGVRVTQQTRIAAVHDGSVVVSEGRLGAPRRYDRGGRLLQAFEPQNTASRFDDIAVDPASGRYFGLDRLQRRIEEVQPLGRSSSILPEGLLPRLPGALAVDGQTLYAAGQDCQCVVAIDLFRRAAQVLAEDLTQAGALAAGEGWLVVADPVERVLRVYREQALRGDASFAALHLVNPQGMAIARGQLYVADAGARRVAVFRLK